MINVLHVMSSVDTGGISMIVLNYYRHMDRTKIHFDIAITSKTTGLIGIEFEKLGSTIYCGIPLKSENLKGYKQRLKFILNKKKYDVIHVHENETSYVALSVAKKAGVRLRFAHSHTSSPYMNVKGELRRLSGIFLNSFYATRVIGCGINAGKRVFGNRNYNKGNITIIPNAINTDLFRFKEDLRGIIRRSLMIADKFVLGTVGRLDVEKNSEFLIRVFQQVYKIVPNAVLVIVGEGPLEDELKIIAENLGLKESVLFLGSRSDVCDVLQAFDVFLLPSIHEGFPIAGVEAIASGLPIVLSDTITEELRFGKAVNYISLSATLEEWVNIIVQYRDDNDRTERGAEVKAAGLDIRDVAERLYRLYCGSES